MSLEEQKIPSALLPYLFETHTHTYRERRGDTHTHRFYLVVHYPNASKTQVNQDKTKAKAIS